MIGKLKTYSFCIFMMDDRGKFVEVRCVRCGNKQIVFGKSSTKVKCARCNKLLIKVSGGKVVIRTEVRSVLG
ncbi:30S ribosomal protein S27e [Candidatus Pacearchaeota archaeon]|nr:30S ribosomal protein S27e [Candidatus Pacearchaeota archaeon]